MPAPINAHGMPLPSNLLASFGGQYLDICDVPVRYGRAILTTTYHLAAPISHFPPPVEQRLTHDNACRRGGHQSSSPSSATLPVPPRQTVPRTSLLRVLSPRLPHAPADPPPTTTISSTSGTFGVARGGAAEPRAADARVRVNGIAGRRHARGDARMPVHRLDNS